VLQASAEADPEAVALQLVGAGEPARAAPYAERAAERAIAKLAFERAVHLFRMALDASDAAEGRRIRLRLAEALGWAGRGAESARAYLEAAEGEEGARRLELERTAAEQLLISGRIDEGAQVLRRVLRAIGMVAPGSTLSALFWLIVYRLRLAVMGLRFEGRRPEEVRPGDRARIDAMYAVAMGFAVVDVLLGACMQARLLVLALRAGDPLQILRAAALEAAQLATLGGAPSKRERELFEVARRIAADSSGADYQAFLDGTYGVTLFLRGRWREAREVLDASNAKVPPSQNPWYANGVLFAIRSLYFSGSLRELGRRQARVTADAHDRGDLYTTVNFGTTTAITLNLAADDPEGARRAAREAMEQWSQTGFLVQHFQAMAFEPDIDLYLGEGRAAHERLMRDWGALRKSLLLNVQFVRGIVHYARGRCAVAAILPETRGARIAEARGMHRKLAREGMPWTSVLAALVLASAENAAGDREATLAALRQAIDAAEACEMSMHAAAARFRLGQRLGGPEGESETEAAAQAIAAEGVRHAARWVSIYLPGDWASGRK
jgi:hypothetical protein